ncbi:MAG: hypothetical protein KatS3mg121_0644 [Gammaproteobacteria bacterium]|nr:MAG: hypothetical protein KatS3mg121_0644 [Gammaproteobacteria bacterium]
MTTTLRAFTDAYASLTVAAYEPLFLRWISGSALNTLASVMASRTALTEKLQAFDGLPLAARLGLTVHLGRQKLPDPRALNSAIDRQLATQPVDPIGAAVQPKPLRIKGFPRAVQVGERVLLHGLLPPRTPTSPPLAVSGVNTHLAGDASSATRVLRSVRVGQVKPDALAARRPVPIVLNPHDRGMPVDFDYHKTRLELLKSFGSTVDAWLQRPDAGLDALLDAGLLKKAFAFFPLRVEETLSPIGIAHYYRQLYFNTEEGFGPIEQCFTVAPAETLEVIAETVRRQSFEEINEVGLETETERSSEQRNLDEISDRTAAMVQNSSEVAISANFSGQVGVYQFGAEVSTNFSNTSQRTRERIAKRLKETTFRASERIRKTVTVKTRAFDETTTTNSTRRVISNPGDTPVNYGLRRVLRKVRVKVQDLGPRMVWQLYIRNPGEGLARSRFVHFRDAGDIAVPDIPPGVPPKPEGGRESGTVSALLEWNEERRTWYVPIGIVVPRDREVDSVAIDGITDLEGGGKDDHAPAPRNDISWVDGRDPESGLFVVNVGVHKGDGKSVSVNYTYTWSPAASAIAEWEAKREAAVAALTQELLQEKFERERALITEQSRIRPRPAADLRQEERYEIMNRMVSHLFAHPLSPSEPTPLELESFHRFFDLNGIFVYMHPSWWKPRFAARTTGYQRESYAITAESEPAPLGSSLRWAIQLDGDRRRNEFLNSPWVRVCVPIRPGQERAAIRWLAKHIEGDRGFDLDSGPLKAVLEEVENFRRREASLTTGPDYAVTNVVGGTPGAPDGALSPQDLYPIIDEFDVTVPTEGFVYDRLLIADGG